LAADFRYFMAAQLDVAVFSQGFWDIAGIVDSRYGIGFKRASLIDCAMPWDNENIKMGSEDSISI